MRKPHQEGRYQKFYSGREISPSCLINVFMAIQLNIKEIRK